MGKWILSLVGIVLISTVVFMLLPEGKLAKYIKSFFGLVVILVAVQPIFTLKNSELSFDFDISSEEVFFQENYLDFIAEEKIRVYQENSIKILEQNGFKNTSVNIDYTSDEFGQAEILMVTIDLKNSVFIHDQRHIDIIEDIVKPVSNYLDIEEVRVNVID